MTTGHGTAEVTLPHLADFTDGYTAVYNETNQRWTLTEKTTGNSVSAGRAGDTWTLTLADRLTLTITRGTVAFRNGDKFVFSVFRKRAGQGAQDLWLGTFDVTSPP